MGTTAPSVTAHKSRSEHGGNSGDARVLADRPCRAVSSRSCTTWGKGIMRAPWASCKGLLCSSASMIRVHALLLHPHLCGAR